MKKIIGVVLGVFVAVVCGILIIDLIDQMPEEWLLQTAVPLAGLAIGLFFVALLRPLLDNKQNTE